MMPMCAEHGEGASRAYKPAHSDRPGWDHLAGAYSLTLLSFDGTPEKSRVGVPWGRAQVGDFKLVWLDTRTMFGPALIVPREEYKALEMAAYMCTDWKRRKPKEEEQA